MFNADTTALVNGTPVIYAAATSSWALGDYLIAKYSASGQLLGAQSGEGGRV